jgi:hypothetical protein
MKKFNEKGEYTRFLGITVICFVQNESLVKIRDIIQTYPDILNCYSLLPSTSYHMTVKNHNVCDGDQTKWYEEFIANFNQYAKMKEECGKFSGEVNVKVTGIDFKNTIQLTLEILPKCKPRIDTLRESLVNLGSKREDGFQFHITLGYKYKHPPRDINKLCNKAREGVKKILEKQNFTMKLEPPKLCYFNDMTNFVPF